MRSTRSGQTFSAPVVMTSSMRPETTSFPSASSRPASPVANQSARAVGSDDPPVVPVAVAAEQHGGPDQDLPAGLALGSPAPVTTRGDGRIATSTPSSGHPS